MTVDVYDELGNKTTLPAHKVVVRDDNHTPVLLAIAFAYKHIRLFRDIRDADFQQQLYNHGIREQVTVQTYTPKLIVK